MPPSTPVTATATLAGECTAPVAVSFEERHIRPVKAWAGVGVLWLAVTIYAWSSWIVSGHVTPAPKGPTEVPTWHVAAARFWEIGMVLAGLTVIYAFLIRPWRREGRLTFDGMFVIGWFATWFIQDPL